MKNKIVLTVAAFALFSCSCKILKRDKKEEKTTIQQSAKADSKETAKGTEVVKTETKVTDNTGTVVFEEVIKKIGSDTIETRRITTQIWKDISQDMKQYKNAANESTSQNKQATQVNEKRVQETVQVVKSNIPFWGYLLAGVAVCAAILYVVRLKYL